jgi:hypothetical protein
MLGLGGDIYIVSRLTYIVHFFILIGVACVVEHIYDIEWKGKWYTLFSLSLKFNFQKDFKLKLLLNF